MLDFLIIGAQKSATTLLHKCLSEHPSIFMPDEEMLNFEEPYYGKGGIQDLERRLVGGSLSGLKTGIKRPDYLALPYCAERIHDYAPSAKLIITLRNPVQRAVSAYYHLMMYGFIPVEDINIGLPNILNGKYVRKYPKSSEIIEYGYYARHIVNYLKYFNRSQLFILLDDYFLNNKKDSIKELYSFIGVDETFRPGALNSKANPGVYAYERLRFINLRNDAVFKYNDENTALDVRKGVSSFIVNALIMGIDRYVLARIYGNSKPRLEHNLENELCDIYSSEIYRLEKLLECDISDWR